MREEVVFAETPAADVVFVGTMAVDVALAEKTTAEVAFAGVVITLALDVVVFEVAFALREPKQVLYMLSHPGTSRTSPELLQVSRLVLQVFLQAALSASHSFWGVTLSLLHVAYLTAQFALAETVLLGETRQLSYWSKQGASSVLSPELRQVE